MKQLNVARDDREIKQDRENHNKLTVLWHCPPHNVAVP